MSLLIVSTSLPQGPLAHCQTMALAEAHRQGFAAGQCFNWAQGTLWWFATPNNPRGSGAFVRAGASCAACVGTFHWRGLAGEEALQRLLDRQQRPQDLPLDEISGSFAMFMANAAGVWLFNDPLGLQKIHQTAGGALRSTSMMVCRATLRRPSVNRLRAQEYVLLGANHALQSPLDDLDLQDPSATMDLTTGTLAPLYSPLRLKIENSIADAARAADCVSSLIAAEFSHISRAFGPNIGMALSGGFDSRLLLAALDHIGVKPHLFVYGSPGDPDVEIAKSVAVRLGAPIDCADKAAADQSLAPLNAIKLRANIDFLDGLPVDGVFDRGADQTTRLQQMHAGRLNLNGGGGEIFRNFFFLRDAPFTAVDVVAAFYTGWLDEVFHSRDERDAFLTALQDRVLECLGREFGCAAARLQRLHRSEVELVYSLFRLRYWMGRNNSVSARYGAFMTPLVTPGLVTLAASLPMVWKDYGKLEAHVISRLSPRVAAGPSAYGFDFSHGPDWKHRAQIALTMMRPVAMRHHSLRVRKALGRVRTVSAPLEWCEALNEVPRADWLNLGSICQLAQLNRLMTLQAFVSDTTLGLESVPD